MGISGPLMQPFTFITPVKKIDLPTFVLKSESFMRGEPRWAGVSDALLLLAGREGPLGGQAFWTLNTYTFTFSLKFHLPGFAFFLFFFFSPYHFHHSSLKYFSHSLSQFTDLQTGSVSQVSNLGSVSGWIRSLHPSIHYVLLYFQWHSCKFETLQYWAVITRL